MTMTRKQKKALSRHKAIVKARNVRNNNLRYNAIGSFKRAIRAIKFWPI